MGGKEQLKLAVQEQGCVRKLSNTGIEFLFFPKVTFGSDKSFVNTTEGEKAKPITDASFTEMQDGVRSCMDDLTSLATSLGIDFIGSGVPVDNQPQVHRAAIDNTTSSGSKEVRLKVEDSLMKKIDDMNQAATKLGLQLKLCDKIQDKVDGANVTGPKFEMLMKEFQADRETAQILHDEASFYIRFKKTQSQTPLTVTVVEEMTKRLTEVQDAIATDARMVKSCL